MPASLTPSAEVGSSRMRTRAPRYSARAMASVWRSPPESVPTIWSVERTSMPIRSSCWCGDPRRLAEVEAAEDPAALGRLLPDDEVPGDAHQREDGEVLVDGGDAEFEHVARRARLDFLALEKIGPLVRRVHAGKDLDQGRLSGAVVAEKADDLDGVDVERDVFERDDPAEIFRDVARLEDRLLAAVSSSASATGSSALSSAREDLRRSKRLRADAARRRASGRAG